MELFKSKNKQYIKQGSNKNIIKVVKDHVENDDNYSAHKMFKMYTVAKNKNLMDIKGWKNKLISKYFPLSSMLINMQLTNGQHIEFITKINNFGFQFDKGFYIIDDKLKYYNASANKWCLDYHEELCFPISRRIKIDDIKKDLIKSDEVELETAVNPVTLQKFMESTVIQKLLAGAEMEGALRFIKIMVIISLIIGMITLLIVFNMSGLLG